MFSEDNANNPEKDGSSVLQGSCLGDIFPADKIVGTYTVCLEDCLEGDCLEDESISLHLFVGSH